MKTHFREANGGAVALIFAITSTALMMFVGMAVDYGIALEAKSRAQAAADAAVLAASQAATASLLANPYSPTAITDAGTAASTAGIAFFNASMGSNKIVTPSLTIAVTYGASGFVVSGSSTFDIPTQFMKMFGFTSTHTTVASTAVGSVPTYQNFHLLLDISQSMGIGATQADMAKLYSVTSPSCVFGCHYGSPISNSQIAKNNGVYLRIDALRDSVIGLITDAKNSGMSNYYKFDIFTMDYNITSIVSLTNNYTTLLAAAGSIDLGTSNAAGTGDSNLNSSISGFGLLIPANGDGLTALTPRQYAVIVTDGVVDNPGGCIYGHCVSSLDPAYCQSMKNKGVQVFVIYTTYLPLYAVPGNPAAGYRPEYSDLVLPFAANINGNLQNCASANSFFEASDASSLDHAFKTIFSSVSRLTN